jgi:beta-phosphoglucomutase-like phosphatase (HAD superfamily)
MSYCRQAQTILAALEKLRTFDFVATRDDVECPKPDPEIYLLTKRHPGVPATETLALEDSPAGVTSALAAGLEVFAVATPFTIRAIRQSGLLPPDHIMDTRAEIIPLFDRLLSDIS